MPEPVPVSVARLCLLVFLLLPVTAVAVVGEEGLLAYEKNTMEVVDAFGQAVVAVNVDIEGERLSPFRDPQQRGGGSGFVIDREGHIITNYHVVGQALQENSTEYTEGAKVTVTFAGRPDETYDVRVVGAMLDYDLALLELIEPNGLPGAIQPMELADSAAVAVGQKAIAIGNPFGLQSTVTTGIVSAIEREGFSIFGIEIPFIQTDAAINPGNSGGPLLNSNGQVIGVNNAILSPSGAFSGVGFAVPSNLLEENLPKMKEGGLSGLVAAVAAPDQPRMGITSELSVSDYPDRLRERFDLPDHGAVVTSVQQGSPAAKAGLREPEFAVTYGGQVYPAGADVILTMEGKRVESVQDMQRIIVQKDVGDEVSVTVWRDGEQEKMTIELVVLSIPEQERRHR